MNVLTKFAGVATFLVALSVAIFITKYSDRGPRTTIKVSPGTATSIPQDSSTLPLPKSVPYRAQLISLDFEKQKSFTTLNIERDPRAHAPDRLWVWTYFFAPDDRSQKIWASEPVEIHEPFASSDHATITATASCEWCADQQAPRSGYYARVHITTQSIEAERLAREQTSRDIAGAIPVLVQRESQVKP